MPKVSAICKGRQPESRLYEAKLLVYMIVYSLNHAADYSLPVSSSKMIAPVKIGTNQV